MIGSSLSFSILSAIRYPIKLITPLTRYGLSHSSTFFHLSSISSNLSCYTFICHPYLYLRGLQLSNFICKPLKYEFMYQYNMDTYTRKHLIDSILTLSIASLSIASITNNSCIIRLDLSHLYCDTKPYNTSMVCMIVPAHGIGSCDGS